MPDSDRNPSSKGHLKFVKDYLKNRSGFLLPSGVIMLPEHMLREDGEIDYQWSDPCLLLSVACTTSHRRVSRLQEIFEAGGMINRATFTEDQLEGGLLRLSHGGWIAVNGAACWPSLKYYLTIWRQGVAKVSSISERLQRLSIILGVPQQAPGE